MAAFERRTQIARARVGAIRRRGRTQVRRVSRSVQDRVLGPTRAREPVSLPSTAGPLLRPHRVVPPPPRSATVAGFVRR